ncbi:MAG: hypothetical protein IIY96_05550 [Lachnospiraceae bacterium]|nr:hypothetical protein [Lachnospiraceae bacterium]
MSKKIIAAVIAVLICIVVVLGIANRNAGKGREEGLTLISGGKESAVSWEDVKKSSFEGDIINGKGESKHHTYEGIELSELLSEKGIGYTDESSFVVSSEDNYTAELSGAEVNEPGRVYIAVTADGEMIEGIEGGQGAQLIVFGDPNQKRAVRYMKTISIE